METVKEFIDKLFQRLSELFFTDEELEGCIKSKCGKFADMLSSKTGGHPFAGEYEKIYKEQMNNSIEKYREVKDCRFI